MKIVFEFGIFIYVDSDVIHAVSILKDSGIVIFPTDTAFGIGCRIDDEKAVEKLFRLRKRPQEKASPVLVDTVKMAQDYLEPIPQKVVDTLIEPYWPGPLTIILSSIESKVPRLVRGGRKTLGVRIPNHPIARKLIREVGVPILGSSANFAGEKTPYAFEDLDPKLVKLVDYVVPGECSLKKASTVIDCSVEPWKILRKGAIDLFPRHPGKRSASRISRVQRDSGHPPEADQPLAGARMTALLIDTSSNQEIIVGLKIGKKEYLMKQEVDRQKAQVVLPMIKGLLKEHRLTLQDLTQIQVHTGPGSFTGIRVGVSVANALSFALKIPVNGQKTGVLVEGVY